ncbi:MAG TPA: hypothetical protein VJ964_01975, partial [Balneolaceae bacterium]|nr:hypothetical protein [Balneolaceae bacterium]
VDRLQNVARDEGINIDKESLHVIAKKADGALRDALGLMDQAIAFCGSDIKHEELLRALNVVSTERMFDFMRAVKQRDASEGLELINELLQEGYDIQEYLVGLTEHLRNLYVAKNSEKMHLVEASPDTKKRYRESAKIFSEDDLMRMLHIVSEAQYKIKEAHQPKIQFEITLLKLIHMERTENLNTLLSELRELKKKLANQPELAKRSSDETPPAKVSASPQPEKQETQKPISANGQDHPQPEQDQQESTVKPDSEVTSPDTEQPSHPQKTPGKPVEEKQNEEVITAEEPGPDNEESDDEFSNLFGTSSLGQPKPSNGSASQTEAATETITESKPKRAPKDISLDEIDQHWEAYLDDLRQHVPQMLYFQMQRVDPIKLKNGALLLRCNDDFAKKIVEENKRRLGKLLEDHIGAFLHLSCSVQKDKSDPEESMSPYERFKKLQERDPTIKKLVELFGAELDYNLNQ